MERGNGTGINRRDALTLGAGGIGLAMSAAAIDIAFSDMAELANPDPEAPKQRRAQGIAKFLRASEGFLIELRKRNANLPVTIPETVKLPASKPD